FLTVSYLLLDRLLKHGLIDVYYLDEYALLAQDQLAVILHIMQGYLLFLNVLQAVWLMFHHVFGRKKHNRIIQLECINHFLLLKEEGYLVYLNLKFSFVPVFDNQQQKKVHQDLIYPTYDVVHIPFLFQSLYQSQYSFPYTLAWNRH